MDFAGEKTEQPTPRKLEEAAKKGQFPRSAEVQTVVVLLGTLLAMMFTGEEIWRQLMHAFSGTLAHLHDIPIGFDGMRGYFITGAITVAKCAGPVVLAAMIAGLVAGGMQSRFQTASEILTADWNRVNPVEGLKRVFSFRSAVPTSIAILKLSAVIALTYGQVVSVLKDP